MRIHTGLLPGTCCVSLSFGIFITTQKKDQEKNRNEQMLVRVETCTSSCVCVCVRVRVLFNRENLSRLNDSSKGNEKKKKTFFFIA